MATDNKGKEPLFQTPNPTELKAEAKEDPIQHRQDTPEADVVDKDFDDGLSDSDKNLGRESAVEMSHSQVTTTNLSGH